MLFESWVAAAQESGSEPDSGTESAGAAGMGSFCPADQQRCLRSGLNHSAEVRRTLAG